MQGMKSGMTAQRFGGPMWLIRYPFQTLSGWLTGLQAHSSLHCPKYLAPGHSQIAQGNQGSQLRGVFGHAAVAYLDIVDASRKLTSKAV